MRSISRLLIGLTVAATLVPITQAQTSNAEDERRQAAVGFFLPMPFSLGVLRLECRHWLMGSDDDIDKVARSWWERNRNEIDAATWVLSEYLQKNRATLPPEKQQAEEQKVVQGFANSAVNNLRTAFRGQVPTQESCRRVVQTYKTSQFDMSQLASARGFEKFSEFSDTFKRIQADPAFQRPDEQVRNFEIQVKMSPDPLISLEAIERARQGKDWQTMIGGFGSLAERGDARAAQTLGIYFLNGQFVARNPQQALAWFYNAWALGDPEGINAIGVMWRDGAGVPVDRNIALAAFAIARQMLFDRRSPSYQRIVSNYDRLILQMPASEVAHAGCITWDALHQKIRENAAAAQTAKLFGTPKLQTGTLADSNTLTSTSAGPSKCAG